MGKHLQRKWSNLYQTKAIDNDFKQLCADCIKETSGDMKRCVKLFEDGTPAPKDYVMFITASLAYPANSSSET